MRRETIAGKARHALRRGPQQSGSRSDLDAVLDRLPTYAVDLRGRRYVVKQLREVEDWDALETLWDSLLLATPGHTVFQSHRYQRLWWRHFGGGSELFILLIQSEGEVVGIAPFRTYVVRHRLGRQYRRVSFIGTRWEVDRPQLLFAERAAELSAVLASHLSQRANAWDFITLYEQPLGDGTTQALVDAFRAKGFLVGLSADSDCPYIELTGTWEQLLASRSQKFRKNLKSARRRLEATGEVHYEVYDSPPDLGRQLERYGAIERSSWKALEGAGITRKEEYSEFCERMADEFGDTCQFVIRLLRIGDRDVAGTFGLVFDGVFYSLQIAHDKEFDRCSPGTYLESREIASCFESGLREYDFLGGFLSNKSRWTGSYRRTTRVQILRRTPVAALQHFIKFHLTPIVKRFLLLLPESWAARLRQ